MTEHPMASPHPLKPPPRAPKGDGGQPSPHSCATCGVTRQERLLGIQMAEMLAGASERAKAEAKPDDPVKILRRMAAEFGFDLVENAPYPTPEEQT